MEEKLMFFLLDLCQDYCQISCTLK